MSGAFASLESKVSGDARTREKFIRYRCSENQTVACTQLIWMANPSLLIVHLDLSKKKNQVIEFGELCLLRFTSHNFLKNWEKLFCRIKPKHRIVLETCFRELSKTLGFFWIPLKKWNFLVEHKISSKLSEALEQRQNGDTVFWRNTAKIIFLCPRN